MILMISCDSSAKKEGGEGSEDGYSGATRKSQIHYDEEKHLQNIQQLTFGGDNAEAYFSFDGTRLVFQSNNEEWGLKCDQIFSFNWMKDDLKNSKPTMVSTGNGRTTCSYWMPGDTTIIFASTHEGGENCPPEPEKREDGAYVWPIYPDFEIYTARPDGSDLRKIIGGPGYDAEATISPNGDKIIFTSLRNGDLDLYVCDIDGSNIQQITHDLGYDGGAFFSPDGSKIVWRASRPKSDEDVAEYKDLLQQGLVKPTNMEIFVANADGSDARQVTHLGQANWAPFFTPDGQKIIFSTNHHTEKGYPFNLFLINLDGTGLEQVTWDGVFDAFPMFSPDGKKLIFSSNRVNGGTRATNLFIADWVQ